ncbi:LysR family transcriptional regulator [Agrobacterium sp. S2]|nr:LysR family transcriptional regulator [Agrobacterium sp. S2]
MLKNSLRYFISVVRNGSIRAASSELHVAQSAISRQLQQLEHEVGQPLLERRARGVTLTPAGEVLFAYGREAVFQEERLESELDALQGLRKGHIRISSMESLVPLLLPKAIDRFKTQYPGITFSVEIETSDTVVSRVSEGACDIGIAFMPNITEETRVIYRSREPLYAVVVKSHPLAKKKQIRVSDLAMHQVGLGPRYSGGRILFDQACREAHIQIVPSLESTSVELLHRFAQVGTGVAVLLRHSCAETIGSGKLKAIRFEDEILNSGSLDVFALNGRRLPVAADRFLAILKQEMDVFRTVPDLT